MNEELFVIGVVVLRGTRKINSQSVREQALEIARKGNERVGVAGRDGWSDINRDAERYVQSYHSFNVMHNC